MSEELKKRLQYYYDHLAQKTGDRNASTVMDYIIRDLSSDEAILLESRIAEKDSTYNRLSAYAGMIECLMVAEDEFAYGQDDKEEIASLMCDVISSVGQYDFEQEMRETINGNEFVFKKTFPLEQFRDELYALGEENKGNRWYVQLGDEGRLVIY